METDQLTVIEKVRKALGRSATPIEKPVPPPIEEPITRLVHTDIGLPALFARRAQEMKMLVNMVTVDDLCAQLAQFLRENNCRKIAVSLSPFMEKLGILPALIEAGLQARSWTQMTLDELYEYDCAVTDVTYAMAETGSLVIHPHAGHGRALSLVPLVHVAILEPKNFVPDLGDLMEKLNWDGVARNVILISGPSKTADIEMNVVTGVHGPNVVKAFILQ